jgi:hypothetical protein
MTYQSRDRKYRLRKFRKTYGNGEFQFLGLNVEPVHQIPKIIEDGNEFDYWMFNSYDRFLISFEKSLDETIIFQRTDPRNNIHIRVKTNINRLDEEELKKLFERILQIGIPKSIKGKFQYRKSFINQG